MSRDRLLLQLYNSNSVLDTVFVRIPYHENKCSCGSSVRTTIISAGAIYCLSCGNYLCDDIKEKKVFVFR